MLKHLTYKKYYYTSLALSLVSIIVIVAVKDFLPPLVPLLYGNVSGPGQLVSTLGLLIAPGVSIFITFLNGILSTLTNDDFIKQILATMAVVISILSIVTILKIIFLVGFF